MSDLARAIAGRSRSLASLGDPQGPDALLALLRLLYAVGREDLPLGRLFEGHVDALQIVSRYGDDAQRGAARAAVEAGGALGVWNADLPGETLHLCRRAALGRQELRLGRGDPEPRARHGGPRGRTATDPRRPRPDPARDRPERLGRNGHAPI